MLYFLLITILITAAISLSMKKRKRRGVIYVKALFLPAAGIIFILCLILFSKTAVTAANKGIHLWLTIVFPSLFPFFAASELLNKSGFVRVLGVLFEPVMRPLFRIPGCGAFTFIMGVTSGYPVGAKITAEMRNNRLLTKNEAERLLAFSNNSGPLFIIGAVAVGMLKAPGLGLFLLCCHIAACITVGILFRFSTGKEYVMGSRSTVGLKGKLKKEINYVSQCASSNIGKLFGDAIRNSVNMMLAIGGFIIFFSVLIHVILETGALQYIARGVCLLLAPAGVPESIINSVFCGFFEITTGCNMACTSAGATYTQQLMAVSFVIGWAGLSVHSQVISIISETDISIKPYLLGKLLQGVIAALYTYAGIKIFRIGRGDASTVFANNPIDLKHWPGSIFQIFNNSPVHMSDWHGSIFEMLNHSPVHAADWYGSILAAAFCFIAAAAILLVMLVIAFCVRFIQNRTGKFNMYI